MKSFQTSKFLRYVLLADAATCAFTGLLMTLGGAVASELMGLPASLPFCAGLFLFLFAIFLVYIATRQTLTPQAVWLIVILNALWTVDSIALLFSGWVSPTPLGYGVVTFQACGVALFALLEYIGLKQAMRVRGVDQLRPSTSTQHHLVVLLVIVTIGLSSEIRAQQNESVSTASRESTSASPSVRGVEELIDRYFDSLNEPDDKRRRELTSSVWAHRGKFGTPYGEVEGCEAINALVAGVQRQFPNAIVRRTSKIDGFGKYLRWSFTLSDAAGKPILSGVDFAILSDGKLEMVMGFFDFAPGR